MDLPGKGHTNERRVPRLKELGEILAHLKRVVAVLKDAEAGHGVEARAAQGFIHDGEVVGQVKHHVHSLSFAHVRAHVCAEQKERPETRCCPVVFAPDLQNRPSHQIGVALDHQELVDVAQLAYFFISAATLVGLQASPE